MSEIQAWTWGAPLDLLRETLAAGGVLAIPTESSYGLGVEPWSEAGVEAIYRLKERERGKPLPVVFAGTEQLAALGVDPELPLLQRLERCWPGPLTAVVPVAEPLPASAGSRSLAVRCPGHARLRQLLEALGTPLTATSANRSGEAPVHDPGGLRELLEGARAVLVDDGHLPVGPPSTVVALREEALYILRDGAFAPSRLRECSGLQVVEAW